MKTTFTQASASFRPIDVTIRIESIEELKQFLLLTSVMSQTDVYDSTRLEETPVELCDHYDSECAVAEKLADFVDKMISIGNWQALQQIYLDNVKENS